MRLTKWGSEVSEGRDVAFPLQIGEQAAIPAKVTERLWEIGDIVNVLEAWEAVN